MPDTSSQRYLKEMSALTPKNIVKELDKYIIGQDKAKRAVAISLRNRWRRQKVDLELQNEIVPNNIILIGPTGVGKTEIARRLSRLAKAPFIKVEASKFTEVGYVGRDVESMVRELMDSAVSQVRNEMMEEVKEVASILAIEKVLDLLVPINKSEESEESGEKQEQRYLKTREKMRTMLLAGKLDDREIEITPEENSAPQIEVFSNIGIENLDVNFGELMTNIFPIRKDRKNRTTKVSQALTQFTEQEMGRLVTKEKVVEEAKYRVENHGIIFIDEIDKIASTDRKNQSDVSRAGVQRDLLPIVEGSMVPTKYGTITTTHILFIAAGAFHAARPSDLIPELQGRFPIRVELNSLTKDDFIEILQKPKNALLKQYTALFSTEKVKIHFEDDAIHLIAEYAAQANDKMEDIGARRLHTIMNALLDDYLFEMPDKKYKQITITSDMVHERLKLLIEDEDLAKFIL